MITLYAYLYGPDAISAAGLRCFTANYRKLYEMLGGGGQVCVVSTEGSLCKCRQSHVQAHTTGTLVAGV